MSESLLSLRRKIRGIRELYGIVRTMKAIAASDIVRYQKAVESLRFYLQTVELGLAASLRHTELARETQKNVEPERLVLVVGSDYGMVGQFNERLADWVRSEIPRSGETVFWAVGERIRSRLEDSGFNLKRDFPTPSALSNVTSLVGRIILESYDLMKAGHFKTFLVFYNRPLSQASYEPASQHLLPLDAEWASRLKSIPWPTNLPPEVIGSGETALEALIREFLFGSLFRAVTESLAAENASRFAAMQRAERNIEEFQADLMMQFHRQRQSTIDEELADVISGFEALSQEPGAQPGRKA